MKRILFTLALIALTALLLVILATGFVELFLWISGIFGLHKELGTSTQTTENYAFVSGIGPIVITTLGFSGLLVTAWKHWNCHEPGCWRHGKYELSSGVKACDIHNPDLDKRPQNERGLVHQLHEAHHNRIKEIKQKMSADEC